MDGGEAFEVGTVDAFGATAIEIGTDVAPLNALACVACLKTTMGSPALIALAFVNTGISTVSLTLVFSTTVTFVSSEVVPTQKYGMTDTLPGPSVDTGSLGPTG